MGGRGEEGEKSGEEEGKEGRFLSEKMPVCAKSKKHFSKKS